MKNQLIKIKKTVYDNRGNEFKGFIIPVEYRVVQNNNINYGLQQKLQQGIQFEDLKEVMNVRTFKLTVNVRAFGNEQELKTPHMAFSPFVEKNNPQSAIYNIDVTMPDAEFTENILEKATVAAFEEKFGKGSVELVDL